MTTLFPRAIGEYDIPAVPGLSYLPSYINQQQEAALAAAIDNQPWDTTWKRRRQLYGKAYGYAHKAISAFPDWGTSLANRMHADGICQRPFDQMLVNEYFPGQGIALHRDYAPYDRTVVSLSLLAPVVMEFRETTTNLRAALLLESRSLLVLSDDARYRWQHGIAARKSDGWQEMTIRRERRLSITFRLLK
jgi:alkylated DNA repair dioxygenase AlkB